MRERLCSKPLTKYGGYKKCNSSWEHDDTPLNFGVLKFQTNPWVRSELIVGFFSNLNPQGYRVRRNLNESSELIMGLEPILMGSILD